MDRKQTANVLTIWGWFNIASPFPIILFTALWTVAVMACFGFDDTSVAATVISMLPMLISPISCIGGFVYALRHRSACKKESALCMWLCAAGLAEMILLLAVLAFLGSIG